MFCIYLVAYFERIPRKDRHLFGCKTLLSCNRYVYYTSNVRSTAFFIVSQAGNEKNIKGKENTANVTQAYASKTILIPHKILLNRLDSRFQVHRCIAYTHKTGMYVNFIEIRIKTLCGLFSLVRILYDE